MKPKKPASLRPIDKVDLALADRDVSAADLAKLVGTYGGRFTKWRKGEGEISLVDAAAIARALDVPLDWLASPDPTPPPEPRTLEERLLLDVIARMGLGLAEAVAILAAGAGKGDNPAKAAAAWLEAHPGGSGRSVGAREIPAEGPPGPTPTPKGSGRQRRR